MGIQLIDSKESIWLRNIVQQYDLINKINNLRIKFNFNKKVYVKEYSMEQVSKLLGHEIPEWVLATNYKNRIIILSKLQKYSIDFIKKIIIHEFVHIIINNITRLTCPLYISDGIAMYYAEQSEPIISLQDIAIVNLEEIDYSYENFYGISYNIIKKAIDIYKEEEIIKHIKRKEYDVLHHKIKEYLIANSTIVHGKGGKYE